MREEDLAAQNRLQWQCRRGLLELDIVLQRFLQGNRLEGRERELFGQLLATPDNELWDIVAGRSEGYDPHFTEIVARLRAA